MAKEPGIIRKLDQTVVNRIAAGEVVQRPANALKELIENSLDAKSTQIHVSVKQGGLKLLQIQDNGTGIRKSDLDIVCQRFTTSKLQEYDDLKEIATYGFRGEALASISHVAHLTITTRTKEDKCAWRVSYIDGVPKNEPVLTAGNQGTTIAAEDLFYNLATRRKALNNFNEEHTRIAEVVGRYAIHNASTGFTLKKLGDSSHDLRTPSNSTPLDNIRTIYGPTLAKELIDVSCSDSKLQFSASGLISNANYSSKKCLFLLFINHRLVESTALRKAIELVYSSYLPKHSHPFLYLSLEIAPCNVDVNVHPTKYEVHFLHQDNIAAAIQRAVDTALLSCSSSRTFYTQALLPGAAPPMTTSESTKKKEGVKERVYDHQLVRTDSKDQKLDRFLTKPANNENMAAAMNEKAIPNVPSVPCSGNANISASQNTLALQKCASDTELATVHELRDEIERRCHSGLKETICNHSFVGCVSTQVALVQYATSLFLTDTTSLSAELFYQIIINNFANFGFLKLSTPASVKELALLALEDEEATGWSPENGPKESLADYVVEMLSSKAELLEEYFSFKLDSDGNVVALPYLLDGYVPSMAGLPLYIMRLATEVDWDREKACFESFARETSKFYAVPMEKEAKLEQNETQMVEESWKWKIEHLVYPAFKKMLLPPQDFAQDTTFLQVASLPDLYKVFERC